MYIICIMSCKAETAFVFDLDKTIGYFTQIAIFLEGIEEFIGRNLRIAEFFKLLDLYPAIFRPGIFNTFYYLMRLKKSNKCVKVLIYTNNIGPKSWVHHIRKYIEHKLQYRLFDRTIAAWKVGNVIYEKCRTTYNKTPKDLIRCGRLKKNSKIVFLDDQRHPDMFQENIFYIIVGGYHKDILFKEMINTFLHSKLVYILKKNKKTNFTSFILNFAQNDSSGFRYIERESKKKYRKNFILKAIKKYVKKSRFKKLTKKRRKNILKKNKTRKI